MRRAALLLLVIAALALVDSTPAHACSCAGVTPEAAFASAEVVFLGEVVDFEGRHRATGDRVVWTYEVREVYKGDVPPLQQIVSREMALGCGMGFRDGTEVFVFAGTPAGVSLPDGQYYAAVCGPTRIAATGPLAVDVAGHPPRGLPKLQPPPSDSTSLAEIAAIAAVVAVGVVVAALRTRT